VNTMKKNPLAGIGKVYRFTLKQVCAAKGWLISTFLIAALLIIGIPLIIIAASSDSDSSETDEAKIKTVFVCDETDGEADYNVLREAGKYKEVEYIPYKSMDEAAAGIKEKDTTVILRVTKPDDTLMLTVYLAPDTDLSRSKASSFADYVQQSFAVVLMQKAKLTPEAVMMLSSQVNTSASELALDAAKDKENEKNMLEQLLSFLLPFMMLMIIYMMVILYGQSMANSVMLEKNSKLIETILTAVHPIALMGGKLLATATAAVLQIVIWLGCLLGGLFGGVAFAKQITPDTENETVQTVSEVLDHSSMFSLSGILLAVVILALGFLLYLSLGAVAGSLATKAEDLGKTNIIFVIVLLVSFFLCMGTPSKGDPDTMLSSAGWLRYFPFTALLLNPSELILGKAPLLRVLISIVIMFASVGVFVWISSAIYKMMLFYRGSVPTPAKLIEMLKDNKSKKTE